MPQVERPSTLGIRLFAVPLAKKEGQLRFCASSSRIRCRRILFILCTCGQLMDSSDRVNALPNPLEPSSSLQNVAHVNGIGQAHPQAEQLPLDSAVTRAEKIERHGAGASEEPANKRRKLDTSEAADEETLSTDVTVPKGSNEPSKTVQAEHRKGQAPVIAEYLIFPTGSKDPRVLEAVDYDAAEGAAQEPGDSRDKKKPKSKGMNKDREFGFSGDNVQLCSSRTNSAEFSPKDCRFGDSCKYEHDLREYLKKHKREDLKTFDGVCPVWNASGSCERGWTCRFVGSHSSERELKDGRKEMILSAPEASNCTENDTKLQKLLNEVSAQTKNDLMKKRIQTPKADTYSKWIDQMSQHSDAKYQCKSEARRNRESNKSNGDHQEPGSDSDRDMDSNLDKEKNDIQDHRANFIDPPFLPSEKRRLYFGPETPVLAPLTTTGNLPFRRLCVDLGAQLTYSEMAVSLPLIQGQKSEWALLRAHPVENLPPTYSQTESSLPSKDVQNPYDNSVDVKFGAQIAANKPWIALKTTEILTKFCPAMRLIDLNCGCPIDLIFRQGAGSALLDNQAKLEKMLRGMNAVSGHVPITCKIRTGTKDNRPTAVRLIDRLVHGSPDNPDLGGTGVAAITLHGRSRQQRYTRSADWSYIADCAALVKSYSDRTDALGDTVREPDPRTMAVNSTAGKPDGNPYFLGNGDVFSPQDYTDHLTNAGVDSAMIGRGALIKPWLFEEIAVGQLLDKSASERLGLVERYARYGLETWGSDERGVGLTRRFLLEWLSFTYRYVPVGILEYLPPRIQDRPPAWRGRNELETLLGSGNYKDWVKIRYVSMHALPCPFVGRRSPKLSVYTLHRSF